MKAGVTSSMESVAIRSARLQAEMSNKQLAAWLAKNKQKLLAQPELQVKEPSPISQVEPKSLREFYAKQDPDFVAHDQQLKYAETFAPRCLRLCTKSLDTCPCLFGVPLTEVSRREYLNR